MEEPSTKQATTVTDAGHLYYLMAIIKEAEMHVSADCSTVYYSQGMATWQVSVHFCFPADFFKMQHVAGNSKA